MNMNIVVSAEVAEMTVPDSMSEVIPDGNNIEINHNSEAMNNLNFVAMDLNVVATEVATDEMIESYKVIDVLKSNVTDSVSELLPDGDDIEPSKIIDDIEIKVVYSMSELLPDGDDIVMNHNIEVIDSTLVSAVAIDEIVEISDVIYDIDIKELDSASLKQLDNDGIDIETDLDQQYSRSGGDDLNDISQPNLSVSCPIKDNGGEDEKKELEVISNKRNQRFSSAPVNLFAAALAGASGINRKERSLKSSEAMNDVKCVALDLNIVGSAEVSTDDMVKPSEVIDVLGIKPPDLVSGSSPDGDDIETNRDSKAIDSTSVSEVLIDALENKALDSALLSATGNDSIDIETDLDQQYSRSGGDDLNDISQPNLSVSCPIKDNGGEDEKKELEVISNKRNQRFSSAPVNLFAAALAGASGSNRKERSLKSSTLKSSKTGAETGMASVQSRDDLNQLDCEIDNSLICQSSVTDVIDIQGQGVSSSESNDANPHSVDSSVVNIKFKDVMITEENISINAIGNIDAEVIQQNLDKDTSIDQLKDANYDSHLIETKNVSSYDLKDSDISQKHDDFTNKDTHTQPKGRGAFSNNGNNYGSNNVNLHSDNISTKGGVESSKNMASWSKHSNGDPARNENHSKQSNLSKDTRTQKDYDRAKTSSINHTKTDDREKKLERNSHSINNHDNRFMRPGNSSKISHGIFKNEIDNVSNNSSKSDKNNGSLDNDNTNKVKTKVIDYGEFPNPNVNNRNNSDGRANNDMYRGNNTYKSNNRSATGNDNHNKGISNDNRNIHNNSRFDGFRNTTLKNDNDNIRKGISYDNGNIDNSGTDGFKNDTHRNNYDAPNNNHVNDRRTTPNSQVYYPTHNKSAYISGPPKHFLPSKNDVSIQEKLKIYLNEKNNVSSDDSHRGPNVKHNLNDNKSSSVNNDKPSNNSNNNVMNKNNNIVHNNDNISKHNVKSDKNNYDNYDNNYNNEYSKDDNAYSKIKATEAYNNDNYSKRNNRNNTNGYSNDNSNSNHNYDNDNNNYTKMKPPQPHSNNNHSRNNDTNDKNSYDYDVDNSYNYNDDNVYKKTNSSQPRVNENYSKNNDKNDGGNYDNDNANTQRHIDNNYSKNNDRNNKIKINYGNDNNSDTNYKNDNDNGYNSTISMQPHFNHENDRSNYSNNTNYNNDNEYSNMKPNQPNFNKNKSYNNEPNISVGKKNSSFKKIGNPDMANKSYNNENLTQKITFIDSSLKSAFANKQSKNWADDNSDDD